MTRTVAAAIAAALLTATPHARQPAATGLDAGYAEVDRLFSEFMMARHVPGAAWGVVVNGGLTHSSAAGLRDAPARAPVDADSVFRIASMTKSFTAISILKLRDEGKLALDDPAEKYVPEMAGMKYPTSDSPRITIRHLLSHATGFPEDNPLGRSTTGRHRRAGSSAHAARRHPFLERARHRLRVFQSRLRHPGTRRVERLENAVRTLRVTAQRWLVLSA